mmetsp:Transcript_1623/g.7190  ORF Transcript_1623/g.7190 Transcript_1623/m.7190 type:complete len:763 (+) Transcript_1623:2949-5237(+)
MWQTVRDGTGDVLRLTSYLCIYPHFRDGGIFEFETRLACSTTIVLPRSVLLRRRPRPLSSTMLRARGFLQRELVQNGFAPFTSLHPVLDATCAPIAGPFEDAAICKMACNAWSHDAGKQPRGTFRMRTDGTYAANMHRGPRFKIRCSNSGSDKLACPFKLVYEKAGDGKFYLQDACVQHHADCRDPARTVAESLARGDAFIPVELLDFGVELKSYGASTGQVLDYLSAKATAGGIPETWTWHHLNRALLKALPESKVNDMEGVVEWLGDRQKEGLPYHIHTDAHGRVDRIFYAMEGAQEMWDRSAGMRLALFDTTHGMNACGMKVGCVSTVDHTGGVHILAVSIINRETGKAFRWVYDAFVKTFGSEPNVLLTDGDLAMAAAAKMSFIETKHHLCVWHLGENLLKHAMKLFPPRGVSPDMNAKPRREFMDAFKNIMKHGGPGRVSPEEYFETRWAKVEKLAMADGALSLRATRPRPPPTSTSASAASDDPAPSTPPPSAPEDEAPDPVVAPQDGAAASPPLDPLDLSQDLAPRSFEEAYMSAEEEVNMEDDDILEEKQRKRAAQRKKKGRRHPRLGVAGAHEIDERKVGKTVHQGSRHPQHDHDECRRGLALCHQAQLRDVQAIARNDPPHRTEEGQVDAQEAEQRSAHGASSRCAIAEELGEAAPPAQENLSVRHGALPLASKRDQIVRMPRVQDRRDHRRGRRGRRGGPQKIPGLRSEEDAGEGRRDRDHPVMLREVQHEHGACRAFTCSGSTRRRTRNI